MTTPTDKATDIKAELRNYANDAREFLNPDSEMTDRPSLHPARADEAADRITALEAERDEQQQTFDMMWDADQRAIKRWQEATGEDMVWPDRAKLTQWLLDQNDALAAEVERLRDVVGKARRLIKGDIIEHAVVSGEGEPEQTVGELLEAARGEQ